MPNNWKTYKLSEVTEYIGRGISPKYTEDLDSIRVVNQRCIRENKIIFETCRNHDANKKKVSDVKFVKLFDVLVNSTGVGTLGRVAQFKENFEKITVDSHVSIVRPKKEFADEFFGYAIIQNQPKIESLGIGSTGQTELSRTRLGEEIEVNIPNSKTERKAIANILSAIDDKIENNLAINKTLEDMAMALYKHWFVDFGPFQEGAFVESELGLIPEGWVVKSVYDIANYVNGAAFKSSDFSEDGLYVIKIAELKSGITGNTQKSKKKIKPELVLHDGAVLFSWSATLDVFLWDKGEALLNQHIFNVIPNGNLNIEILYFLLRDIIYHFQAIAASRATTMGHIKISHLKETLVALPSIENQKIVNDKFSPIFNQLLQNKTQNQTLIQLRDTLLPKLICGEVRLKEFQKQIETVL